MHYNVHYLRKSATWVTGLGTNKVNFVHTLFYKGKPNKIMTTNSSKVNEMGELNLTNLSRRDATQMGDRDIDPGISHEKLSENTRESKNIANNAFYQNEKDPQILNKVKQNFDQQQDPFKKKTEEKNE